MSLSIEKTVGPVATAKVRAAGETLATDGHRVRAAWMETAARWRGNQAGNLAPRRQWLRRRGTVRIRSRRDQQLRVGMLGLLDDRITWAAFNTLPRIHDQCVLGEVAGAGDIMRDEEDG